MVRVRFAPSPTGYVHIGSLRTALYNFLYAKKMNGSYVLRIEDTDQTRYVEGSIENLINCLVKTGIVHEEGPFIKGNDIEEIGSFGPYTQSKRLNIYNEYIEKLIEKDWAYTCFCSQDRLAEVRDQQKAKGETPKYDGKCRQLSKTEVEEKIKSGDPYVIRLKLPVDTIISFEDMVRGSIVFNTNDLDDQVLIKTDGFPTYHFAVVVDDHLMGITHIIRGEEWLPSTPKHVALYKAFKWEEPKYVHLPNILNDDKKKLSKRQGDVAVEDFLKKGYLPEALINYIALLGWSPDSEEEVFTMEELIQKFDLTRINKSGAVFDRNKLNWMNSIYIKSMENKKLVELITPYLLDTDIILETDFQEKPDYIQMIVETFKEKLNSLSDIVPLVNDLFKEEINFDDEMKEILKGESVPELVKVLTSEIERLDTVTPENIKKIFKIIQKEHGIKGKNLYMPVRVITTGETHGSDLMMIMSILGKEILLKRINSLILN
ncbi:glutamate--tRNA ligase [Alkalibaculum sp. M08DMB]|uniref:Glutamate--tRNA ligase n=1 Tax=Alkalibaculum sporogenes TaxID=2655001 RepID=A0A6A7KDX5_9FIRM|nr:glutamate--tRNA ligase [Alkalibaculum sporogenes]MPW27367.1 glutamate--tRNA ligase [Alkalibaculum sporogenes]